MLHKATGIVRRIDPLGRIVLPKELRRTLSLREGDPVEFYVTQDSIVLKRFAPLEDGDLGLMVRKVELLMEQLPDGDELQSELLGVVWVLVKARKAIG